MDAFDELDNDSELMQAAFEQYLNEAVEVAEAVVYEEQQQQQQQTGGAVRNRFKIVPTGKRHSTKFGFEAVDYDVDVTPLNDEKLTIDQYINAFFEEVFTSVRNTEIDVVRNTQQTDQQQRRRVSDADMVRLCINHPKLNRPINVKFSPFDQLTSDRITDIISKTMQSREEFCIDSNVKISVIIVPQYEGGRRTQHVVCNSIEEKIRAKRCVVQIDNQDSLCMIRALVVSKAYCDKQPNRLLLGKPILGRKVELEYKVHELISECRKIHRLNCTGPYNLVDLAKIQQHLSHYRIVVVDAQANKVVFDGWSEREGVGTSKIIGLLYHNKHYHALTNVGAWFEGKHFCYGCMKSYEKQGRHRCAATCSRCMTHTHGNETTLPNTMKKCIDCQRTFLNDECFANHKTCIDGGNKTVCATLYICKQCNEYYNGYRPDDYGRAHECGKRVCRNCGDMVTLTDHRCYMLTYAEQMAKKSKQTNTNSANTGNDGQPQSKRVRKEPYKFIFWDSEARQENAGKHEANLFIAHITCELCINNYDAGTCAAEHERTFTCYTSNEFGEFLYKQRHATFIAHNFKGYDSQFILDYCTQKTAKPEVIVTGCKCNYMYFNDRDIRFIDSYSFLPMPLAKFPETFGFNERRKGYFPHYFNTIANADYSGPLPAKHFYGYNDMKIDQRIEFDKWYDAEVANGTVFNMRRDIWSYCDNDVAVLRIGCTMFRQLLLEIAKTDPFREAITIASAAQLIFRKLFLQSKQIGLVPPNGYRPHVNQSKKALLWLKWLAATRNITIRDCRHPDGEYRIGRYTVDGYDTQSGTVFEFLGSYWHGDMKVFKPNTFNQRTMCPMSVLHERTLARQADIELRGFKYESIWESEWDALMKSDTSVRDVIADSDVAAPLEPRDAFFGGRTNASQLYYCEPKDCSSIKVYYVDFCSLYPTVNKYGKYPTGHPDIITDIRSTDISGYFGLCKCAILPPNDLYHPVLPYRHPDGKLMFPLCIKCADVYSRTPCTHTDQQRKWVGTWTTIELQHAVLRGYKILHIFEVWHFNESTQYDKSTNSGGLFAPYVNMFIKIKQEASGLPPNVQSDAEITQYIDQFYEREGVRLERDKIAFNPGLRYTAKLFLNSLWGKFGQRSNLPRTEFVSTFTQLNTLLQRQDIEVMDLMEFKGPTVDDDICQVQYKLNSDFVSEESVNTNIFVAAFTTAQARLMLLKELEKLDTRVLYYDTDSIIYIERDGDAKPETGCFLGELTHELKPGEHIVEFFSGGPKNYGYRTSKNKIVQKHKGITLNARVLQTLTFEAARDIVLQSAYATEAKVMHVELHQIRRSKANGLQTVTMHKRYGFAYDKRVIVANYNTLPYGHKNISSI